MGHAVTFLNEEILIVSSFRRKFSSQPRRSGTFYCREMILVILVQVLFVTLKKSRFYYLVTKLRFLRLTIA